MTLERQAQAAELSKNADVEVRFDTAQSSRRGGKLLGLQRMQVVASPSFLAGYRAKITKPQHCFSVPRIMVIGTADTWESFAEPPLGAAVQAPVLQVESHGLAVDMAIEGLGLAYTNSLIAQQAVADQRLKVLFESKARPSDGYYLVAPERGPSRDAQVFIDWLNGIVADR